MPNAICLTYANLCNLTPINLVGQGKPGTTRPRHATTSCYAGSHAMREPMQRNTTRPHSKTHRAAPRVKQRPRPHTLAAMPVEPKLVEPKLVEPKPTRPAKISDTLGIFTSVQHLTTHPYPSPVDHPGNAASHNNHHLAIRTNQQPQAEAMRAQSRWGAEGLVKTHTHPDSVRRKNFYTLRKPETKVA